jgi:hypothetical protein
VLCRVAQPLHNLVLYSNFVRSAYPSTSLGVCAALSVCLAIVSLSVSLIFNRPSFALKRSVVFLATIFALSSAHDEHGLCLRIYMKLNSFQLDHIHRLTQHTMMPPPSQIPLLLPCLHPSFRLPFLFLIFLLLPIYSGRIA